MDHWIDAKNELPDKDGRYLACCESIFIANYIVSVKKWKTENLNLKGNL